MKCYGCGREIKDDEDFYIHEDTIYCSDCVKEETVTYYMMDGEILGQEDEVQVYDCKNEALEDCKKRIERLENVLKNFENRDKTNHWYMSGVKYYNGLLEIEKELLKNLLDME